MTRWPPFTALTSFVVLANSVLAECPKSQETLFACKAQSGERIALCGSRGILVTDNLGTTKVANGSTLQFRATFKSETIVLPAKTRNPRQAFLADRGSAKAASSWWANLSVVEDPYAITLEVGMSDAKEMQLEFKIEDKRRGVSGTFACTDVALEATTSLPGVPSSYFQIVSALAE